MYRSRIISEKAKLSLGLTEHHAVKMHGGDGGIASVFVNLPSCHSVSHQVHKASPLLCIMLHKFPFILCFCHLRRSLYCPFGLLLSITGNEGYSVGDWSSSVCFSVGTGFLLWCLFLLWGLYFVLFCSEYLGLHWGKLTIT